MKFEIIGRNYEVSEKLKEITEKKLSKLDKYFSGVETVSRVCFKKQAQSLTIEVMLEYANKFIRATATSDNFYDDLDLVLPKLEGQIRKYRTRFDKHSKNVAFKDSAIFENEKHYENHKSNLVKQKKFKLTPMTVKEAIEEMEMLGHSFFVFLEAKSNMVQILYIRQDGDIGLIEPEY